MANRRMVLALGGASLVAGGFWWLNQGPGETLLRSSSLSLGATPAMADTTTPAADAKLPDVPDMSMGNPNAKVTMIEYGSFTCPHCEEFHASVWPLVKKNYIDTGKVRFTFREVYFDKYGLWAGMMAHCAGPMRYFGVVDILYNTQQQWAATDNPNQAVANIRKIGTEAGLTNDQLDQCMNDGAMAQALVAKFQKDTAADKIKGTPSFVIDGTNYENMSYAEMSKILDAQLAKNG